MIQPLSEEQIIGALDFRMKRYLTEILNEGSNNLEVAAKFAKRNCSNCGGNGFTATLKRAGAAESEPRVARICGCARARLMKEALRRKEKHAAERAAVAPGEPSTQGEA